MQSSVCELFAHLVISRRTQQLQLMTTRNKAFAQHLDSHPGVPNRQVIPAQQLL
jgi:hypothetical protein